jgi:hypothetical protein
MVIWCLLLNYCVDDVIFLFSIRQPGGVVCGWLFPCSSSLAKHLSLLALQAAL